MPRYRRWLATFWLAAITGIIMNVGGSPAHANTETGLAHISLAGPHQTSGRVLISDAVAQPVSPALLCGYGCKPTEQPCDYGCKPTEKPCYYGCKPREKPCHYGCKPTEKPCYYGCKPTEHPIGKPPAPPIGKPPAPPIGKPTEQPIGKPTEQQTQQPSAGENHELPVTGTAFGLVIGVGAVLVLLGAGILVSLTRSVTRS